MNTRSSAWPLALLFAGLVVYASLYPFTGWRVQGVATLSWMLAPWPQYWTGFDLASNLAGYVPLGFLLAVAALRSGWSRGAWVLGAGGPAVLSLLVESLQTFLPMRVPSNVDFCLNAAGGALGAAIAVGLDRLGAVRRWSRFRADWFQPSAHGGLVLLGLWPLALLYPVSVPFGLGQVWDRLSDALALSLADTPFVVWLPDRSLFTVPLSPLAEAFCIALGLLAPLLMAYGEMHSVWRRALFIPLFFLGALGAAGLSAALTWGPVHAWAWIGPQVVLGGSLALALGIVALALSRRLCNAVMLLCLGMSLTLLNRAPDSPYFVQSLEVWEQGRFIRFHGLSQWLGWLWPFAALLFGLRAVARSSRGDPGAS